MSQPAKDRALELEFSRSGGDELDRGLLALIDFGLDPKLFHLKPMLAVKRRQKQTDSFALLHSNLVRFVFELLHCHPNLVNRRLRGALLSVQCRKRQKRDYK